ncbi:MAG TPA: GMC family oxidoreductase [Thermoanaerobaculia bacterium]|jgi:choline dehydrogenase-like flavoprotein|nr:GMC family oxidoreductase [Thermoanaerobaculia bacterium]
MARNESTHTLIVGSGVAGGLIAERLLAAGMGPVTMLEAGANLKMRDRRSWLDFVTAGTIPYAGLSDVAGDYETAGTMPWLIEGGRLMARGGSTLHWGGWCPRMKPEDFEIESRIGFGGLDWPFSYDDLQPYYERAESYLQVAGDSNSQDPPRRNPYPFEAPTFTLTDGVFISALERLGISYGHLPIARNARGINGNAQCVTFGTCDYCPVGARFTGDQPLDRLQARHDRATFELRLGAAARRVLVSRKHQAVGVEYVDLATGAVKVIEAEEIILCAGSYETPKLLIASASPSWPHGIGNDTDQVGRYVIAHPFFFARGFSPTNPLRLQEELNFPTAQSRHWDTPEFQREGKFILTKAQTPLLDIAALMGEGRLAAEIDAATAGAQTMDLFGSIQIFSEFENRVLPANGTTRFGLPRTRIETPVPAFSAAFEQTILDRMNRVLVEMGYTPVFAGAFPQRGDHAMCTCRMSESPARGVVDPDLKVHGMDNLHIVSNAVFASGGAANPTLTLTAVALRFLDRFVADRHAS